MTCYICGDGAASARQAFRAGGPGKLSDVDCPACGAYRIALDAIQQIEQLDAPVRQTLKQKAPAVFQAAQARFLVNEAAVFDILRGAYDD